MFLLEPYEVFFGLRPENSGFIKNAPFVVGLGKVVEDLLDAGCCRLIRRRYRVWFNWGNVMLTWTVEVAAAAAELSVMTSSP